jgi:hypothetical protein
MRQRIASLRNLDRLTAVASLVHVDRRQGRVAGRRNRVDAVELMENSLCGEVERHGDGQAHSGC